MYDTKDSKRAQKIKTAALEFSRIFIVIFNNPPECVLVDDFNHKVIVLFFPYKFQFFLKFNILLFTGFLE